MALAEGWDKEIALKDLHRWVQRNDLEKMKWLLENGVDPSWSYGELRSEQPYRNAIEQADIDGNAEALALFADFETLSSQRALGMDLAQAAIDNDLKKLKELMPRIRPGYRCALGIGAKGFAMFCITKTGEIPTAAYLHENGAHDEAVLTESEDFAPDDFISDALQAQNFEMALWLYDHDYGRAPWGFTREKIVELGVREKAKALDKVLPQMPEDNTKRRF